MMKQLIRNNTFFLTLSLLLSVSIGLALIYIPKDQLHLILCNRHTPVRDTFYRYYTQMAEWIPYVICILLLFYRAGSAALASISVALSGICTQIIKHIVNAPRPLTWFASNYPDVKLQLVEGVKMSQYYSFPSGHTTTFFALFFALSIIITDRLTHSGQTTRSAKIIAILAQIVLFIAAMLGGYSRIYLSQHFASDVLAGIAVGTLITIVSYAIFHRFETKKWYNYHFFEKKCI